MKHKVVYLFSMLIFGSIGIFVRWIPLPSAAIAFTRGGVGCLLLCAVGLLFYRKTDWAAIRRNLVILVFSGIALGLNWIFFFEAFRYTTISVASVCYYFAPVLIVLLSPIVLKERLTGGKLLCVLVALIGLVCIAGANDSAPINHVVGVLFGLGAAVMYAGVVLLNKKLTDISGIDRTMTQLGIATVALLPYILLTSAFKGIVLDTRAVVSLIILCVIHTGLAFLLFFISIEKLPGHTVALLSYVDPLFSIVLSVMVLGERMTPLQIVGAVLVLGATLAGEYVGQRKRPDDLGSDQ